MSDMIDAAAVRRKNMRRAIGRILLQYHRNQTDITAGGSGDVHFKTADVMVTQSKADTPQALKHELLA